MAVAECNYFNNGGGVSFEYIPSTTINGNAEFEITGLSNKPKGCVLFDTSNNVWYAEETETYAYIDGVETSAFPTTFGANSIDFGRSWGGSATVVKGYYWY